MKRRPQARAATAGAPGAHRRDVGAELGAVLEARVGERRVEADVLRRERLVLLHQRLALVVADVADVVLGGLVGRSDGVGWSVSLAGLL